MRSLQLITAGVALSVVAGCAGASSSDDVAACMQAMAAVSCPPGTAPTSQSAGDSATQIGVNVTGASGSNLQNIGCNYTCAPICMCGIDRVEGDGAVVCSPCFGVEQRALTGGATPQQFNPTTPTVATNPNPTQSGSGQVASRQQTQQQPATPRPTAGQGSVVLDFTAPPLFEHHTLTAPFRPDPFGITVRAGGNQNISDANVFDPTGGACTGFVNAQQPDIAITYYSRGTPLLMSVVSDADTTLIVNMPDGTWRCNDDATGSTLNPRLYFPDGQSGRYNIWIGTYQRDSSFPIAQFRATTQL